MLELAATNTIAINAPMEFVWEVLTSRKFSVHYMFNCEVITTWEIGSPVEWKGNYNGYEAHQVGTVIEFTPFKRLTYSTFDPNFGLEDLPENYIHVTYELKKEDQKTTHLSITNKTFDGHTERFNHILEGWNLVAPLIAKTCHEAIA